MSGNWRLSYTTATLSSGAEEIRREEDIPCTLSEDDTGIRVRYEEAGDAEAPVSCILTVCTTEGKEGDRIRFERRGEIRSFFLFSCGGCEPLELETPYGRMTLETETRELEIKKNRQQIEVKIRYRIYDAIDEEHLLVFRILKE